MGLGASGRREEHFDWRGRGACSSCGGFSFMMKLEGGGVVVAREGDEAIVGRRVRPNRELYCCKLAGEDAVEGSSSEVYCYGREEPG